MLKCFGAVVNFYAKKHWNSELPVELRATKKDVVLAVKSFLQNQETTKNGIFIRLVGQSGTGKTTQLLPAARDYCAKNNLKPVIIAAREFAKMHPHYEEILRKYGKAEIRRRTDDFATMVMFLVLDEITRNRMDFILDLSFVSTKVEWMFLKMARRYRERLFLMMAVPVNKNLELLGKREWRHTEELEKEFLQATKTSLEYYGRKDAGRIIMWGFDSLQPIYDGRFQGSVRVFEREMKREKFDEGVDVDSLRENKRQYLIKK